MNIRKFKEIVGTRENSEENFRLFRIWIENCYVLYEKNYNLAMAEANQFPMDSTKLDELEYDWTNVAYNDVVMAYSELGWGLDENLKGAKISHDTEWDCLYYGVAFPTVYEKIQTIENNIEFAYAVLSVLKNVDEYCNLYTQFTKMLYKGLKEYELFYAIDMIGKEQKKKVFIAMSFDNSMKLARDAIIDAIQSCGYVSMLIDIKEHNNQIVPEIYKEISDSEFVVADLTGQRGGVYYEAGYAVAKDKELILCCKQGENPHFDVAQINTIFWKDEQDLKERLVNRIRATVGVNK